jgi:hypothetical protein
MTDPHVVSQLRTKQAEIQRLIAYLEDKLKDARIDLAHVNATLRLFEVGSDPQLQFPAHVDIHRLFRKPPVRAAGIAACADGAMLRSR